VSGASTSDEVRTPNFFSIYESSKITTTDEGTKAGKIICGYVEETLREARREYRFRDETERKHFEKSDLIMFLGAFHFRRLNRDRYWKPASNPELGDIIPYSLRHLNIFVPRLT
jgi:hypothetical protein